MVPGGRFILTGSFKPDCLHTNVIREQPEQKLLWQERIAKRSLHLKLVSVCTAVQSPPLLSDWHVTLQLSLNPSLHLSLSSVCTEVKTLLL